MARILRDHSKRSLAFDRSPAVEIRDPILLEEVTFKTVDRVRQLFVGRGRNLCRFFLTFPFLASIQPSSGQYSVILFYRCRRYGVHC